MIHYRCGECGAWNGAVDAAAGTKRPCAMCGRLNVCPPASGASATVAPVETPRTSSLSLRRLLAIAAVTTVVTGAAFWLRGEEVTVPPVSTPSEARQRDLLGQNVGKPGEPELVGVYEDINRNHFGGRLPAIPVRWDAGLDEVGALAGHTFTLEGMYGRVGAKELILLNPRMMDDPAAVRRALAHEMVHASLALAGDSSASHGPSFKRELRRLAEEHAFEGIAADDEERAALRAWLDRESARLERDQREVESMGASIDAERATFERDLADLKVRSNSPNQPTPAEFDAMQTRGDRLNDRVREINERIERGRQALAHFNDEIARYNLMIVYPDGLDETGVMPSRSAAGGAR